MAMANDDPLPGERLRLVAGKPLVIFEPCGFFIEGDLPVRKVPIRAWPPRILTPIFSSSF